MALQVSYKKHIVSGTAKGTSSAESQPVVSQKAAIVLQRILMEITDLFPAADPTSGDLCYVTDIELSEINELEKEKA